MNRDLFNTKKTNTLNSELAPAYAFSAAHALAQYASTGCLNQTFYASAEMQLQTVLVLADQVPAELVAKIAIWAREKSFMKDLPALLVAYLTVRDPQIADRVFDRVIDDTKMLRNFVQILRSGLVARRSLASMPKRLVKRFLASRTPEQLFRGSIGEKPSLGDVIKMAHPRPDDATRSALYAYLTGRSYDVSALPEIVRAFEQYKAKPHGEPPPVPFALLTALELGAPEWSAIAKRASWQETRMNLNTYARHGVFSSKNTAAAIAARLKDREAIRRSKVLPYQLLMAFLAADQQIPRIVKDALEAALDVALENVPRIDGKVYVCADVSGSMKTPVTGHRKGATSKVRCVDVAGLIAAAMMRVCDAEVLPFEQDVVNLSLKPRDTVIANATKLASIGGGGTNCSAPLALLNARRARGDLVLFVSDNESWVDARRGTTAMVAEWHAFKERNPRAKLVCIDLVPNHTTQAFDDRDVLNVGGFSDAVFEVISDFVAARSPEHWIQRIAKIEV